MEARFKPGDTVQQLYTAKLYTVLTVHGNLLEFEGERDVLWQDHFFTHVAKLNRLPNCLDASPLPESREPEPQTEPAPTVAPAWATVRFPSHPSDILKLLSDI